MMKKQRNILLLGNSLILGTLGERLLLSRQFELTRVAIPLPDVGQIEAIRPDAILFDLATPHVETVFALLENWPQLLLIGVSADTNLVRMWRGRQLQEMSTQSLLVMIEDQLGAQPNNAAFEDAIVHSVIGIAQS